MELRAPACRGAAGVKAVRPRAPGSGATPPAPSRAGGGRRAGAGAWAGAGAGPRRRSRPPRARCPSARGALLPAASRARASGAQSPGPRLRSGPLTQAPGARADVTPGHVCGRPGGGDWQSHPAPGAGSARLRLAARGPPCAGASCGRRAGRPVSMPGAATARGGCSGAGRGRPSPRRRPSAPATPRGAAPTRPGRQPEGRVEAGRGAGPLDGSENPISSARVWHLFSWRVGAKGVIHRSAGQQRWS
nr:translation initiation factor IF-2-like isoform X1 [Equus asinus]